MEERKMKKEPTPMANTTDGADQVLNDIGIS